MNSLEKRILKLEAFTPKEPRMTLAELYKWQKNTPEGKAELDRLYNPDRYELK